MSEIHTLHIGNERMRAKCAVWLARVPLGWSVEFKPPRRSDDQSRAMWAILTKLAKDLPWHGQRLSKDDYKDLLTAGLKGQRAVPGIDGGFVVLGARTRDMAPEEMSELIEFAQAFAAQHGVDVSAERESAHAER